MCIGIFWGEDFEDDFLVVVMGSEMIKGEFLVCNGVFFLYLVEEIFI